ncbi:unnamed protein product [Clonostachys chloroleuca]|uniref:Benzoate 4-monooxygenase cytochrome P450 n=1 Tax=Clonostachys chloroleuca TaxID=1926264 RepID=A0AA35PXE0_9HYPO|nr:unnamed protein product [Clonostachys chloroleuca]
MFVTSAIGNLSYLGVSALLATLLGGYAVSTVVYRLFFHPLAKYPGPFWCKISGWPAHYHTAKQNRHVWLWSLQQQYGPTFRYTPDKLSVNTATGLKEIYNLKANVGKGDYYGVYPRSPEAVTTWNTTSKETHNRKRRVMNNAFSDKALRNAEPFVHANLNRWCDLIKGEIDKNGGEWSGSLNMADWTAHLIFDILGDLCFGKSFDMKEHDSKLRYVPDLMIEFMAVTHPIAFSPIAAIWVWLKPRGLNSLLTLALPPALADWAGFVQKCFEERAKIEEEIKSQDKPESEIRKDFFHYLISATDPITGQPSYGSSELFGESESLIIAGSDTTATSTAAATFYLVRNPDVQERLAAEVRQAFPSVADIKGGDLLQKQCKYLQAFIKETLRMSPPTPADMPREVGPNGISIDGEFVPQGVVLSTCAFCLHHSEDLYDEPFSFRPERWIVGEKGSTVESVARADSGYMPFSAGPRSCPGKSLAYLEMSVVIAKLVHQFELRQDPKSDNLGGGSPDNIEGRREVDQYQLYDIFVSRRFGPVVQFKRRA